MKLLVIIKNVYGNEMIYPVCDKAKLLCKLSGKKTFTKDSLSILKQLGYEFEIPQQTI